MTLGTQCHFVGNRSRSFTNRSWKCVLKGNLSLWTSTQLGVKAGKPWFHPLCLKKQKKNFGFDQIDGKAAERIFYLNWNNFILLLSFPTGCRGLSFTEGRKWLLWRTLLLDSGSFDPPSARNKHHGTHIHFKGPSDLFETSISFQVLENLQVFWLFFNASFISVVQTP